MCDKMCGLFDFILKKHNKINILFLTILMTFISFGVASAATVTQYVTNQPKITANLAFSDPGPYASGLGRCQLLLMVGQRGVRLNRLQQPRIFRFQLTGNICSRLRSVMVLAIGAPSQTLIRSPRILRLQRLQ